MMHDNFFLPEMQNPEPAVDFDTVANKKQQHEVNVGMIAKPLNILYIFTTNCY